MIQVVDVDDVGTFVIVTSFRMEESYNWWNYLFEFRRLILYVIDQG
jgi:hypothetical protein